MKELPGNGEVKRLLMGIYRAVVIAGIIGLGSWVWTTNATIAALVVKVDGVKEGLGKIENRLDRLEWGNRGWGGQP